jgi:hypothetical protein
VLADWWVPLSEVVRNFGLLGAAIVGVVFGAMRVVAANRQSDAALRQAELARRGHVAELFNGAVGQLGDPKLQVRLGAVYTLRQIAEDFPDLTRAVFELLSAYLRERPPEYGDQLPPPDVREIMRILRERLRDER